MDESEEPKFRQIERELLPLCLEGIGVIPYKPLAGGPAQWKTPCGSILRRGWGYTAQGRIAEGVTLSRTIHLS